MLGIPRPVAAAGLLVALGAASVPALAASHGSPAHPARRVVALDGARASASAPWSPTIDLLQVIAAARGHTPATTPGLPAPAVAGLPMLATALPPVPLAAYRQAAALAAPGCHLPWELVAGIGTVESGNAEGSGALSAGWDGVARPPIFGPVLDGSLPGTAVVRNTDPALDGPGPYARAVGPMQFLPSTWGEYAVATRRPAAADPQDIYDAAATTGAFLCANGGNLADPASEAVAVYSYNPSVAYVEEVLSLAAQYAGVAAPRFVDAPAANGSPAPTTRAPHRARPAHPAPQHTVLAEGARPRPSPSGPAPGPASPAPAPGPLSGVLATLAPSAAPPSLAPPAAWSVTLPGVGTRTPTLVSTLPTTAPTGLELRPGTVPVLAGPASLLAAVPGQQVTLAGPSGTATYVVRSVGSVATAPAGDLVLEEFGSAGAPLTLLAAPA